MQLLTKKPILKKLWYGAMVVLSSAALCAVCLLLAFGVSFPQIYIGYFRHPLIFLLNWLPMLLVQLLLLAAFNRQWLAFLINGIVFASASIGNFFMLKIRMEPFKFSDVASISAGLGVAGNYDLTPNSRIYLLIAAIIFGTVFLAFLAKGGFSGKLRIITAALCLLSVWPLWSLVYSNKDIYNNKTENDDYVVACWSNEEYIARGFIYPFIHSILESGSIAPAGYDKNAAAEIFAAYSDSDIPEDKRVNIVVIQLESFSDYEGIVDGISPECYERFRQLKAESMSGTLIPNVTGGGTIKTEHAVLTGSYDIVNFREPTESYAAYMARQGYSTVGSHPNTCNFYDRVYINRYLGFQDYWYLENHYQELTDGDWECDDIVLPEVFRQLRELNAGGKTVFSFNPTLQTHSPYNNAAYDYEHIFWENAKASPESSYVFNNYLASTNDTMYYLSEEIDKIRDYEEPVVLLIYGDHKPSFTNAPVYEDADIVFDTKTEKGFIDYYATPYMIWANDAAKENIGHDFVGDLPMISPCYMMNVLFEQLGWEGSAFMKFTDEIMEHVPVASINGGYVENGVFSTKASEKAAAMIEKYRMVQYYCQNDLG